MRFVDADNLKYKNLAEVNGKLTYVLTAEEIDNAPTVEINTNDVEYKAYCKGLEDGKKIARPQGEWIEVEKQCKTGDGRIFTYTIVVCSECGEQYDLEGEKFCPHCGADMRGKEE